MMLRRLAALLLTGLTLTGLLLTSLTLLAAGPGRAQQIGGAAPRYTDRALSATPLDGAIRLRHWAPGLNDGYVPQGLTMARGTLFVGAYHRSEEHTSELQSLMRISYAVF